MTLGRAPQQGDLFDPVTRLCDETLAETSIYGFLHRDLPVPDAMFADLFVGAGRPVGATVGGRGGEGPAAA